MSAAVGFRLTREVGVAREGEEVGVVSRSDSSPDDEDMSATCPLRMRLADSCSGLLMLRSISVKVAGFSSNKPTTHF